MLVVEINLLFMFDWCLGYFGIYLREKKVSVVFMYVFKVGDIM